MTTSRLPSDPFHVRLHGRGGQGVVTAAELLGLAAFDDGFEVQGVPEFRVRTYGCARHVLLPRLDQADKGA